MNPMPPIARDLILFCVGFPAALGRALAIGFACTSGTLWLQGTETFFRLPSLLVCALFLIGSLITYLLVVGVEYVTAKHRDAVPLKMLISCVTTECLVQVWGITGASMVLGGMLRDPIQPLLVVLGPVICIGTIVMAFANSLHIREWRAAWNGDCREVPPPLEDMP
jgi:hypothetical protein